MKVNVDTFEVKFDLAKALPGDVIILTEGLLITKYPLTLLRTYHGWVSLENPVDTWEYDNTSFRPGRLFGYKLPKGTEITLIVE